MQDGPRYQKQRADMQALDYTSGNQDRTGNNFMVELGPDGEFIALHAIANGVSFAPRADLPVDGHAGLGLPQTYDRENIARRDALLADVAAKGAEAFS